MKHFTKFTAAMAALILAAGSLSAFDYGLELSNAGGIKDTGSADWYTDHKATLWLSIPFDAKNGNNLSIEGSAYAAKPAGADDFRFYADLALFRLSLVPVQSGTSRLAVDVGRFPTADITGFILNQAVDGTEFHFSFPFANMDILAGYTGLLNVRKTNSLMTADDYTDADTTDVYAFGASRAIGKITWQMPHLVGKSDLVAECLGQYDMRRYTDSAYNETVDTVYGTLSLNGPLTPALFYTLSGTFQTGILETNETLSVHSVFGKARLDFYPDAKNKVFAQFLYSPPGTDFFSYFLPITFQQAGTLYTAGYDYLMLASAGWNFNPLLALNFDANGKVFMYPEEQTSGDGLYRGTEVNAGATLRVTTDLRFRLDSSLYFPSEEDLQYQASLKAILDL